MFLREHKRRRKVSTDETVRYYRSLFKRYLEGRELSEELVDYVVSHENGWLRNVFRHYVQYLYYRRKIPLETFGWLMEVVPSRGYRAGVRVFEIDLELFEVSLRYLRERCDLYYLYFLLMYYSGIRLEHVVKLVATFKPREIVYIPMLDRESPRLVCPEGGGFCRYYLGLTGGKPCEWVYFPRELLKTLSLYSGELRESATVSRYFTRHDLLSKLLITHTSMPAALSFWKCSFTEVLATSLHVTHSPKAILLSKNIICSLIAGDLRYFSTYSATLGGIPLPMLSPLLRTLLINTLLEKIIFSIARARAWR